MTLDRKPLMLLVRELVRSATLENFKSNYQNIIKSSIAQKYPAFLRHVENMLSNAEEWALCFRSRFKTRGHHTNNFAESAIGIIKSTVLNRKKAYNVTELVEVLIRDYDKVIQDRLMDVALMREKAHHNPKLSTIIPKEDIDRENTSNLFFVCSQSDQEKQYLVDRDIPVCNCGAGANGKFCKHILAIHHWYPDFISIAQSKSKDELFSLLQLAIGEEATKYNDFYDLESTITQLEQREGEHMSTDTNTIANLSCHPRTDQISQNILLEDTCKLLKSCCFRFEGQDVMDALQKMNSSLLKLSSGSKANFLSAMYEFGKGRTATLKRIRRRCLIKVQPTAISRRKEGQSRGSGPLMTGKIFKQKTIKKRQHNLIKNIHLALPNGKKH